MTPEAASRDRREPEVALCGTKDTPHWHVFGSPDHESVRQFDTEAEARSFAASQPSPSAVPELCGEKNHPGSHPCNAPKDHKPGPEQGGHYCRYEWPAALPPSAPEVEDLASLIEKARDGRYSNEWLGIAFRARLDANPPSAPEDIEGLRNRLEALEAVIHDGAIPAMRWAARRLSVLGEDAAEVAKLDADADKIAALASSPVAPKEGMDRALDAFFEDVDADWHNDNLRPGSFAMRFHAAAERLRAARSSATPGIAALPALTGTVFNVIGGDSNGKPRLSIAIDLEGDYPEDDGIDLYERIAHKRVEVRLATTTEETTDDRK